MGGLVSSDRLTPVKPRPSGRKETLRRLAPAGRPLIFGSGAFTLAPGAARTVAAHHHLSTNEQDTHHGREGAQDVAADSVAVADALSSPVRTLAARMGTRPLGPCGVGRGRPPVVLRRPAAPHASQQAAASLEKTSLRHRAMAGRAPTVGRERCTRSWPTSLVA